MTPNLNFVKPDSDPDSGREGEGVVMNIVRTDMGRSKAWQVKGTSEQARQDSEG